MVIIQINMVIIQINTTGGVSSTVTLKVNFVWGFTPHTKFALGLQWNELRIQSS